MALVDTHCHLQEASFDADREAVLDRALSHLDWLLVIGDTLESSRKAIQLAHSRDRVYASAGIHPHHADQADEDTLDAVRELTADPRVVAVGEIGLDYYYDNAPRDAQRDALHQQLKLATQVSLPVIVHSRDADDDMAAILAEHAPGLPGGVLHCFSSGPGLADACLDLGLYISFAGIVTFPKAHALREVAQSVPIDRILVETDSPYLAPPPYRGKRCEPVYVEETAKVLAELLRMDLDEFAHETTRNAERLFGVHSAAATD